MNVNDETNNVDLDTMSSGFIFGGQKGIKQEAIFKAKTDVSPQSQMKTLCNFQGYIRICMAKNICSSNQSVCQMLETISIIV